MRGEGRRGRRAILVAMVASMAAAVLSAAPWAASSGASTVPPPVAHDHASHTLPDGPVVLEGRLSVWHGDEEPAPREKGVTLDVDGHAVPVALGDEAAQPLAGNEVRVRGRIERGVLVPNSGSQPEVLAAGPVPGTAATSATAATAAVRRVAVILVSFTDNTSRPWTAASVENTVLDGNGDNPSSVRAWFEETSDATVTLAGDVFGWYTIAHTDDVCDYRAWATSAKAAAAVDAAAVGVDLTSSSVYKVYAFPNTAGCTWSGLGELPGDESWIDGSMTLRTVAHELGHNFGAHHASTMTCRDAVNARMATAARRTEDCTLAEYGDPFTIMGGAATRTNHAWHRVQTTHPIATQAITLTAGYDATHTVSRLEPGEGSSAVRLLRIIRPSVTGAEAGTFLDLELRGTMPAFDTFTATDPAVTGVSVRIGYATSNRTQSKLVDTTLATTGFGDAPLQPGQSLHDPLSGALVTLVGVVDGVATLRVQHVPDTAAPTAATGLTGTGGSGPSVALRWSAATDDVRLAGYEIRRNGVRIAVAKALSYTDTCTGLTSCPLVPGATSTYEVIAYDAAGKVAPPASVSVRVPSTDDLPPSTVTGLAVSDVTATSVALTWDAATDEGGAGIGGYEVLVGTAMVATTAATTTAATVGGLAPATPTTFTVRAFDAQQNRGAASDPLTVTTEPAPSVPTVGVTASGATASITYSAVDTFASYEVRREVRSSKGTWGGATVVARPGPCAVATCAITDTVTKSGTYRYAVRAVNGAAAGAWALGPEVTLTVGTTGGGKGR